MSSVRIFLASFSRSLENSGQNVLLERVVVVCNGMEGTYIPNLHMWHSPYLCKKAERQSIRTEQLKNCSCDCINANGVVKKRVEDAMSIAMSVRSLKLSFRANFLLVAFRAFSFGTT
nr:hypothetical protein CFP56_08246 [Quercus suber]